MAGINLIKQLNKARKEGTQAGAESAQGGLSAFMEKFRGAGGDGGEGAGFERDDYIALGKFVFGVFLVFGAKFYVENIWNAQEQAQLEAERNKITQQVAQEKAKLNKYKQLIKEIDENDKRIAEMRKKLDYLDSVLKNRNITVKMIDFIVKEMPEAVWLEDINLNPAPPDPKIRIKGFAINLQQVSDFIKNLEGAVFFPAWNLVEGKDDVAPTTPAASSAQPPAEIQGAKRDRPPGTKEYSIEAKVVI